MVGVVVAARVPVQRGAGDDQPRENRHARHEDMVPRSRGRVSSHIAAKAELPRRHIVFGASECIAEAEFVGWRGE